MLKDKDNYFSKVQSDPEDKAIKELKKWFYLCIEQWKWIVLSVSIGLVISVSLSLYLSNRWEITSEVVKKSTESSSSSSSDFISMLPIDALGAEFSKINIEYEKRYFTSREILYSLIDQLQLNVHYFNKNLIKEVELYKNKPFRIEYNRSSSWIPKGEKVEVVISEDNKAYQLFLDNDTSQIHFENKKFIFGNEYKVNGFNFTLFKENSVEEFNDLSFVINSYSDETLTLRKKISFNILGEKNTDLPLIQMKTEGNIPDKEKDILITLVSTVQKKDIQDKNFATKQSAKFIQDQLQIISDSMQLIANQVYKLKTENTELAGGAELVFEKIYRLDDKRNELQLSIRYCDYLLNNMNSGSQEEILMPEAYGITGSQLTDMLSKYSEMKLEDALSNQRLKKSILYQEEAIERDKALKSLRLKITDAIGSTKKALSIQLEELNTELKKSIQSTNTLLSEEKTLQDYQRLFETHEQLYRLLLEKQAEYSIRAASTISDYTMLSVPEVSEFPVFPKRKLNVLIGLALGLLLPVGIFYIIVLFDTKVRDEADVKEICDKPYIGNIITQDTTYLLDPLTRSLAAESYRNFRTNLQFMLGDKDKFTILVTSSISGEGKSVTSANLSNFYTILNKKVILIGADLRKPVFKKLFPKNNENIGLSNYLSSGKNIEDYIQKTDNENLDLILSGTIPPNPTELLQGEKMNNLMAELNEKYDIVIYDTAPIGIVSDARKMMEKADLVCYATRQGRTPKSQLERALQTFLPSKDIKMALFMTDVNMSRKGGYQYSYYGKDYISYLEK
ncbi:polysaccharide biosynthesis tyrosine autokinase [Flammeovirga sp. EKP202]|uniref:polysaccharide biosynthesis tyrosine autokinase n=1 Tax=Flammeovirga sp. EKP202 TaxID=2770592 RepID=UPI00165F3DD6|nr:polysaccharide biosynthesis tyrosine autokinase [Flammeovirga sp. EKP202]MBD0404472.1 polysaccharide biosynthesis tyrosine autokinase [Flammeovirga sp. EKP202]